MLDITKINEILFRSDPMNISIGDNTDEYESEAEAIFKLIGKAESEKDIQRIMTNVFVDYFNEQLISKKKEVFLKIAEEIWKNLKN